MRSLRFQSFSAYLARQSWRTWALAALVYGALCLPLWLLLRGGLALAVGNLLLAPAGVLAARATMALRPAALQPRLQRAWAYLGLALWLWTLGGVVWAGYGLLGLRLPVPSLGDPLYMAGHFLALAALLSFAAWPRGRLGRFRLLLDLAILSGAVAVLGWLLLLQPVLAAMALRPAETAWTALYPALDLLLVIGLADVSMALEPGEFRSAWGWISGGVLVFVVADLLYTYLGLRGQTDNHFYFDLGRLLALASLGVGAVYQRMVPGRQAARAPHGPRWRLVQRVQSMLPLATVFALGWYTFLGWRISGVADNLAVWTTVLLSLLLVARQGVVAGEVELEHYAHLVNNMADPAFICDALGRLRLINPALVTAVGYESAEDLAGRSVLALLAPRPLPLPGAGAGGALPHGPARPGGLGQLLALGLEQGWSGEVELIRRDGSRWPAYLALRPVLGEAAAPAVLAGIAHDLTEQKHQQAELRQAYEQVTAARRDLESLNAQLEQKVQEKTRSLSEAYDQLAQQNRALQALDRLKSDFVSMVSHELRAPLTNIGGGMELVLARPQALPAPTREALTLVQAEISRLTQFVETILDLSALEAGRLPLYPAPLALEAVMVTVQAKFAAQAVSAQMASAQMAPGVGALPCNPRLCFQLPPGLPLVLADERGLTSVLFHLLDNALKYAPEGAVEVEARADGDCVYVLVTDHGPGIPWEARELIFEKFQRLDGGDAQAIYGHGLGLYMVRRLLQAMRGDVKMEPAPGGGARFIFWLPAAEEAAL